MNSSSFQEYLSGLSITQLREHQNLINSALSKVQDVSKSFGTIDSPVLTRDVNNYVDYFDSFLDSNSIQMLLSECLSMGFSKKSANDSVQNKFVSLFTEPYCWNSTQGPVINNPLKMDDYPTISRVMGAINEQRQHGAKLNSCLVSYYKNGHVRARLHCDDEAELDHTQHIAVVSLGAVRNVEFVDNKQESFRTNACTLKPSNGSLYLMKAGCQQAFRHRVRMNKQVKDFRISISFRSFIPPGSVADSVHDPAPISPVFPMLVSLHVEARLPPFTLLHLPSRQLWSNLFVNSFLLLQARLQMLVTNFFSGSLCQLQLKIL